MTSLFLCPLPCVYEHMDVCVCVCVYEHIICGCVCACVCVYVCMSTWMCVCVCVYQPLPAVPVHTLSLVQFLEVALVVTTLIVD